MEESQNKAALGKEAYGIWSMLYSIYSHSDQKEDKLAHTNIFITNSNSVYMKMQIESDTKPLKMF